MAPKKEMKLKGNVHFSIRTAPNGKKIGVLTMDNPPMNPLSSGVRTGLFDNIQRCVQDSSIHGIVITGANNAFCAGADISEFSGKIKGAPFNKILGDAENSPKPVVAAIDGVALGGGCELSLACHWRLATKRSQVGLPEVNLGILPGAGGTQRMPRLLGAEKAIDLIIGGAPLNSTKAAQAGVFDQIVDGNVVDAAVKFASTKVSADLADRRLCNRKADFNAEAFAKGAQKWTKLRKGEHAPQAILRCIEAACKLSFDEGLKVEQKEFFQLMTGDQAKALQYMFFAERACTKVPGLTASPAPLNKIGIIGAGLMGGGIAMSCAEAGMDVVLIDASSEALQKGIAVIRKNYERSVQRGSMPQARAEAAISKIKAGGVDYSALRDCDLIVEAVFENMGIKKEVFAKLDAVAKPGAILATNTSYLSIDEIASATKRPEDVIGCHFFSPPNVMKLLENVRGAKSSPRTIATAMAFGKKIGKVPVLVGNCWGFVANRMMAKQGAMNLLHSGVSPRDIDAASEEFGMRMGPIRMNDLVGIDLLARERAREGIADPKTNIGDALYAAGRFGQKNGKGFYRYGKDRKPQPDPEADQIIATVWKNTGVTPRKISSQEIVDALYLPVINEGFKCLEEGIAVRSSDIDVCLVHGYNFPRYRGGPMQYADTIGLDEVVKGLKKLGVQPSKLLSELADDDATVSKWSKKNEKKLASKL